MEQQVIGVASDEAGLSSLRDVAANAPADQADRDVAAMIYDHFHSLECFDPECGHIRGVGIRAGKHDDDPVVQILRRNRPSARDNIAAVRDSWAEKLALLYEEIVEAEKAHWLKEALKHKRPSGRPSECAARDLDRARVAQRILDKFAAIVATGHAPEGTTP